ncbi:hypothetical protein LXL04_004848 [Taraxacum kok-saghyz]
MYTQSDDNLWRIADLKVNNSEIFDKAPFFLAKLYCFMFRVLEISIPINVDINRLSAHSVLRFELEKIDWGVDEELLCQYEILTADWIEMTERMDSEQKYVMFNFHVVIRVWIDSPFLETSVIADMENRFGRSMKNWDADIKLMEGATENGLIRAEYVILGLNLLLVVFWFRTSLPLPLLSAALEPCCCQDGADVFGLCFAVLVRSFIDSICVIVKPCDEWSDNALFHALC